MLEQFYHTSNTSCNVIIITAIFGNIDIVRKPSFNFNNISSCFHLYSDSDIHVHPWQLHKVNIPSTNTQLLSRIPKMLAYKWITNPYILWIDGKHSLKLHPIHFTNLIGNNQFLILPQYSRSSLEDEYYFIYKHHCYSGRINCTSLKTQYKRYYTFKNAQAYEASIFMIYNKNPNYMENWYTNYTTYFPRDQLALDYVLAIDNITVKSISKKFHYKTNSKLSISKRYDHKINSFYKCTSTIAKKGLFPFYIFPVASCIDAYTSIEINISLSTIIILILVVYFFIKQIY